MKDNAPKIKRKTLAEYIPNAPPEAIDLMEKLFTYDPKKRLTAMEVLKHPFLEELYDPENDDGIVIGNPISYYDFEFEQYTINRDIVKELILDEIIMANSSAARILNKELKEVHKDGILEKIYERQDSQKKKQAAEAQEVASPTKIPTAKVPVDTPAEIASPTKKPKKEVAMMNLQVNTTGEKFCDESTEDNSPSKMSYGEGQSPVRSMPSTFQKQKTATEFQGINLRQMNKDAIDEAAEFQEQAGSNVSGEK